MKNKDEILEEIKNIDISVSATAQLIRIGTKYKTRGKAPRLCTVVDIHKTYNVAGELIQIRYVSTHEFMGQEIRNIDVIGTTIAMGIVQ